MMTLTRTDPGTCNTSYTYCEVYNVFDREELEEFAKSSSLDFIDERWRREPQCCIVTNIACSVETDAKIKFRFEMHTDSKYGTYWYLKEIDTTGWNYTSRPFFRNMDLDLQGLVKLYTKKYAKVQAKKELKEKELLQERKLNDINTDDFELELQSLAEKYGFEYESSYPTISYYKNKTYKFEKNNYFIQFASYTVKSKNIHCWSVYGNYPFVNQWYNTYVGTFDQIKQVAEGYMMMFKEPALTSNYDNFKPGK